MQKVAVEFTGNANAIRKAKKTWDILRVACY